MVIVCTMTGSYFTSRDRLRVRTIEELLLMIQIISTEIKFSRAPLDSIIIRLNRRNNFLHLDFIEECVSFLKDKSFPEAWKLSVRKSSLHNSDKQLLLSLGDNLGTSDVEGQLSNCELHRELLENNLKNAREKCVRFGKLYTSLGVLGGFLIAVLVV